ncbi:hypothetical protein KKP97_02405 [Methanothermococcus sp. SCGC AD-155-C09]|nr:hypothetical protein [Methanothermococcus sp. SCGC AD-155-C09]
MFFFIISAATYLLRKEWWWIVAILAIVISQILIIIYWQDVKFGTITNIIIFIASILSYGSWSFKEMINKELNSFLPKGHIEKRIVTTKMIKDLPSVVQKWLSNSNIIGKEIIETSWFYMDSECKTCSIFTSFWEG